MESFHGEMATFQFKQRPFTEDGVRYPSTEHYYQAHKLKSEMQTVPRLRALCQLTETEIYHWGQPGGGLSEAEFCGAEHWEQQKRGVMMTAISLRFSQRCLGRQLLKWTGNLPLVSIKQGQWGWPGGNMLGELVQEYRDNHM